MREQLVYLVEDESGALQLITPSLPAAEQFVVRHGNENWTIESEEMC
jgi:hypothetical protein